MRAWTAPFLAVFTLTVAAEATGQTPAPAPAPVRRVGYLAPGSAPDILRVLSPPPTDGDSRDAADLPDAESVGRRAGGRALRRLGARKIATTQAPVLFEAPIAASLLGHFVSAVSGGNLYRKSSFLLDSAGKQIFAERVDMREEPHLAKGLASTPFDEEGVATNPRAVVSRGVSVRSRNASSMENGSTIGV